MSNLNVRYCSLHYRCIACGADDVVSLSYNPSLRALPGDGIIQSWRMVMQTPELQLRYHKCVEQSLVPTWGVMHLLELELPQEEVSDGAADDCVAH